MRFDQTGPRYKDHLLLRWWEGAVKNVAPTRMVRLDATSVGFATGVTLRRRQSGELRWGNRKSPYAWWQRSTR